MNELDKLRLMLKAAEIPFEDYKEEFPKDVEQWGYPIRCEADKYRRNQIVYGRTSEEGFKLDAIYHLGSYGREKGNIEIWGDLAGIEPYETTAEKAFEIIKLDWKKNNPKKYESFVPVCEVKINNDKLQEFVNEAVEQYKPKRGKWNDVDSIINKAACSNCGKETITEPFGKPPFCQWCGAVMEVDT